jgi:HAD superfamily hydrolase (TIGR01509 family)
MIKGFFFDLDGTLVDTHRANHAAYRSALLRYGVDISYSQFKKSIGHQAKTFLPWFAPGLTDEQYEDIARLKGVYYGQNMKMTRANLKLISFLESIKPHYIAVLVTTAKRHNADTVLSHYKIENLFDHMISAEDVSYSKPDPESYHLALTVTGLTPDEVVVFEDSTPGIEAASRAGISAIIEIREFHDAT